MLIAMPFFIALICLSIGITGIRWRSRSELSQSLRVKRLVRQKWQTQKWQTQSYPRNPHFRISPSLFTNLRPAMLPILGVAPGTLHGYCIEREIDEINCWGKTGRISQSSPKHLQTLRVRSSRRQYRRPQGLAFTSISGTYRSRKTREECMGITLKTTVAFWKRQQLIFTQSGYHMHVLSIGNEFNRWVVTHRAMLNRFSLPLRAVLASWYTNPLRIAVEAHG